MTNTTTTLDKLSKNARARVEQMKMWYESAADIAERREFRNRITGYCWGLYDAGFLSDLERRLLYTYMTL